MHLRYLTLTLVWISLFVMPASVMGGLWTVGVGPIELMDPLASLSLIATGSITTRALIAGLPLVLLILVLGRFFCGWLCPYRPLLYLSRRLRGWITSRGGRLLSVRLGPRSAFVSLGFVLLLSAAAGFPVAVFVYPPAIMMREASTLVLYGSAGLGLVALAGMFLYDVFVSPSGFCQGLCPGGALFRLLGRASPVKLVRNPAKCSPCKACDVACPLGQAPMTDRVTSGCERCGLCAAACPTSALRFELGRPLPVLAPGEEQR